jgi:DNA repair exonuclease SbcCD ATPase subunit
MHTKTELSPDAYKIAYQLFKRLSEILPVILIAGNHDCIMTNLDRLDALTPIISSGIGLEKVHYLKKTGFYQYYNIIFGFTDMFIDEPLLSENITSLMLKNIKQKNKYKIALYHGPIRGSKTDLGYEVKSDRFRSKDFREYDYGFFGDIHKHQYMNDTKTIAYAGSLIQQSYGESLDNHGILKWDLLTGKSKLIEIPNDYGYCKINIVNGKIMDEIILKKPRIKFILDNTTQLQFQIIKDEIEQKYDVREIISENKLSLHALSVNNNNKNMSIIGTNHNKFIKSYLNKRILNEIIRDKIFRLHKKIYNKMISEKDLDTKVGGQHWKLIELNFSNMFSYGKNNVVNLAQYQKNHTIGIVGPNHYGKSAILDIILYCLFEKSSRGDARCIMNKNENTMHCSLLFSIGNNKYLIERTAKRGRTDARMDLPVNFIQIKNNGKQKILNGVNKTITNENIIELIGTYDDYLTSYICTQDQEKHGNFMNKTADKKKEYLYEILKLDIFDECYKYANDKLKKLKANYKSLQKEINCIPIKETREQIKKLNNDMLELKKEKHSKQELIKLIDLSLIKIKAPELVAYHELLDYNLNSESDITVTIDKLKTMINDTDITKINEDTLKYKKSIDFLKNENTYDETISKYNDDIQNLYNKIINVHIDEKDIDFNKLMTDKKNYTSKISKINDSLIELNKKLQSIDSTIDEKISQEERDRLTNQLSIKEEFARHINKTIEFINLCANSDDKYIIKLQKLQNDWLNTYNVWKLQSMALLKNETYNLSEIKNQIKLLTIKKEAFNEKLFIVCDKINKIELHKQYFNENENIKSEIQKNKSEIKKLETAKTENKIGIKNLKKLIEIRNDTLNNYQKYIGHIKLLNDYKLSFGEYCDKKQKYDKTIKIKNNLEINLNNIDHQIETNQIKKTHLIEIQNNYDRLNIEFENTRHDKELYESYCQIVNTNGVPYEILKSRLPQIETNVNQTLHNMVDFNVEFVYYDGSNKTKMKQTMKSINAIDIHIHYQNQKPYQVQLTSGFEKFIIGIAIRMVLCNISNSAKPNFFIIDEGWSCLDTENLSNIDNIMTYIKNQFEHVIIISHLKEIKEESDYIINIDRQIKGKKNEYSYVNNLNNANLTPPATVSKGGAAPSRYAGAKPGSGCPTSDASNTGKIKKSKIVEV